jgi:hypothetical protein
MNTIDIKINGFTVEEIRVFYEDLNNKSLGYQWEIITTGFTFSGRSRYPSITMAVDAVCLALSLNADKEKV